MQQRICYCSLSVLNFSVTDFIAFDAIFLILVFPHVKCETKEYIESGTSIFYCFIMHMMLPYNPFTSVVHSLVHVIRLQVLHHVIKCCSFSSRDHE